MTEKPSEIKKIFEPECTKELLRGWLIHSHKGRQRHDMAARSLDGKRILLGASSTVLAVIVSTSVFTDLGKQLPGSLKFTPPVITLISPILIGLSTFLNLAERVDKHRSAGVRYKAMIRELEGKLSQISSDSSSQLSDLKEIKNKLDELEESAPIIPEKFFRLVEKDWKHHGVKKITEAYDLYPDIQSLKKKVV